MKINLIKNIKILLIVTVCFLLVGMVLLGVLGYNQSVDYRKAYEVDVKVYSLDNAGETAKEVADDYFSEVGIKDKAFAFSQTIDEDSFSVLKYKFAKNVSDKIDIDTMEEKIKDVLIEKNLATSVETSIFETKSAVFSNVGKISLALGLSVVAIFIYLFFTEKLASALSVIISGAISGLLFISLMAITRIPATPFVDVLEVLSVVVSAVLSAGLVVRFKEEMKNVANSKLSYKDIAVKATNASLLRYIVVGAFMILASILLCAIGKGYFKFLGLQILIVDIVSIFSSIVWTPFMWSLLKKEDKKYIKAATSSEE